MALFTSLSPVVNPQMQTIRVPERGRVNVSRTAAAELLSSEVFWKLIEHGVLATENLHTGQLRLCGGCYVGRARVSENIIIDLHEKIPGSLRALFQFASASEFRVAETQGLRSPQTEPTALLVEHFISAVRRYCSKGRKFKYTKDYMQGSLIRGRIDLPKTLRLHARGHYQIAAFETPALSFDLPINGIVLAALHEALRMAKIVDLSSQVVARLRSMSMLFADCFSSERRFPSNQQAAQQAEMLSRSERDHDTAHMLSLASIILSRESLGPESSPQRTSPLSWFLNLETLFERAIRETMRIALAKVASVGSGRASPRLIFPTMSGFFRANPDLVVRHTWSTEQFIGDVKYKEWSGVPASKDIYQLLVHAAAFSAGTAFLVFPNEKFQVVELGSSVTNTKVLLFGIEIGKMNSQVHLIFERLCA